MIRSVNKTRAIEKRRSPWYIFEGANQKVYWPAFCAFAAAFIKRDLRRAALRL